MLNLHFLKSKIYEQKNQFAYFSASWLLLHCYIIIDSFQTFAATGGPEEQIFLQGF